MTIIPRPALLALFSLLFTGFGHAAKVPMERDELEKEARCVIRGTVVDVTSKVQKSTIETGPGIYKDTIYTITVRVTDTKKGKGLEEGAKITVLTWKPHTRVPPLPGLQGQVFIPKKGQAALFYLTGGGKQAYRPLLPNGIVPTKPEA